MPPKSGETSFWVPTIGDLDQDAGSFAMVTGRARLSIVTLAMASAFALVAPSARANEAVENDTLVAPAIEMADRWRGTLHGSYLSPKSAFVADDGGFDVVFHFHAGQMSERQIRESGLNAVFVSSGFGIGSGPYADMFADTNRFERMLADITRNVAKDTGKSGVHVRRVALVSWSAGFAAIGKILGVDRYYAMVDTVVLLDSLHSPYLEPNPKTAAQGADRVDVKMMAPFVRFAKDAAAGKKAMAITHSAIIPPDYASSTEATSALLTSIAVPLRTTDETNARGMRMATRADAGNLHVRGFRGRGPKDHFQHLYLIGEVLRSWTVPRWKRDERLVYTLAGEQL